MKTRAAAGKPLWLGEGIIIGIADAERRSPRGRSSSSPARCGGAPPSAARRRTDGPRIVDWCMEGRINIDDLITHTMPLEHINLGFELMENGESIRSVVLH
jgi:S-(hydroxymethyl)glutathione dehydrogenase/alcohol dehydrogenase